MAGVMLFEQENKYYEGADSLFWQISWVVRTRIMFTAELAAGDVRINSAKYIAALIPCETSADFCAGKITLIQLDNIKAKV